MSNNRWAFPTTLIIALIVAGGLLFQTQQLSNTQTELTAAREEIVELQATATQMGDERIAQATAAAATEVALLDSAAATQSALQSAAATAQAQAAATQTAQANAAATAEFEAQATESALQSAIATQAVEAAATQTAQVNAAATAQAQAQATQSAQVDALAVADAGQATLAADLATLEAQATQSAVDADATQIALLATATQAAAAIAELDAQVETQLAEIAAMEATQAAVATQIAEQPSAPIVSIDQPVAPVTVESLYISETFDNNNRDLWYEGDFEREGRLDVEDGVYRFAYAVENAEYGLVGSSISATEPNSLLEYNFRMTNCTEAHDTTYIETLFYSNQTEEYGLAIFCNRVAWSLIRVAEDGENLGYSLFNSSDTRLAAWHTMSIWFGEGEVTWFLDGVELGSQELPRDAEGYTYLRVYSEDQAVVEFDNIRVWETPSTRATGQLMPVRPDPTPTPAPAVVTENENVHQEAALQTMLARFPNDFSVAGEDWELVRLGEIFIWEEGMLAVGVQLTNSRDEMAVVLLTAFDSPQNTSEFWEIASATIVTEPPPDALTGFPDSVRIGAYDANYAVVWWEQTFYTSVTLYSQDDGTPARLGDLAAWVRDNVTQK